MAGINSPLEDLTRGCHVEIINSSANIILTNPQLYIERGRCSVPLTLNLKPESTSMATFVKASRTATGAVGVFTYELSKVKPHTKSHNDQLKLAVMYSVPFNRNMYSTWFAIGLMRSETKCCQELYTLMYYNDGAFVRGKGGGSSLIYKGEHVVIQASMSDTGTALLKVEVSDEKKKKTAVAEN